MAGNSGGDKYKKFPHWQAKYFILHEIKRE